MRITLLIALLLIFCSPSNQQLVCSNNKYISSPYEVDAISGCTTNTGSITISINDPVFTTLHLENLQDVYGSLTIYNNPYLQDINLPLLKRVGSSLVITQNAQLSSISINAIATVGSNLTVNRNPSLVNFFADSTTTTFAVEGDISLTENGDNLNVFNLNALKVLGGNLNIRNQSFIGTNTGIYLNALECAKSIIIDSIDGLERIEINNLTRNTNGTDLNCTMKCYQCGTYLNCNNTETQDPEPLYSVCTEDSTTIVETTTVEATIVETTAVETTTDTSLYPSTTTATEVTTSSTPITNVSTTEISVTNIEATTDTLATIEQATTSGDFVDDETSSASSVTFLPFLVLMAFP